MPRLNAVAAVALLALPTLTPAADPLADAVKEAVAARKLRDSNLKGSAVAPAPYREVAADGGVLVGLEVGLGGSTRNERVIAVRPVYRIGSQNRTGSAAGRFLSDEVNRTVRLVARDGYAVAGVTISAGHGVNGLAVRFARTAGGWLDQADTYESDWVGKDDGREPLDGEGRPVVGLFGRVDGDAVVGLGLIFADLPRPEPRAAGTATPAAGTAISEAAAEPVDESRGMGLLPFIVFGVVAIPVGVLGVIAFRRKHDGLQELPRVTTLLETPATPMPDSLPPPSIPSEVRCAGRPASGARPLLQDIVDMETDCFRN